MCVKPDGRNLALAGISSHYGNIANEALIALKNWVGYDYTDQNDEFGEEVGEVAIQRFESKIEQMEK
jgi:hypothetical protein